MYPHSRAGLAGLRLGYGIAHKDLVTPMMAIKQPYNVNTASEVAGLAGEPLLDSVDTRCRCRWWWWWCRHVHDRLRTGDRCFLVPLEFVRWTAVLTLP